MLPAAARFACSRLLLGTLFLFAPGLLAAVAPQAVPTFHSIGLTWKPAEGAREKSCTVQFRAQGETTWREALPLWFDDNAHPDAPHHAGEYRGSLLNLHPGTAYEIKLQLAGAAAPVLVQATTWSETFRIKSVRPLPGGVSSTPLVITEGGSATDGYVVYASPADHPTVIDVGEAHDWAARITASHVILRGVTLRGGRAHGLVLGDVTDVVIERCDISGWGEAKPGLVWGKNLQSAIYSESRQLERIVIQRNRLHHPRSDANSWAENGHPEGPQGITFKGPRGQLVIRYNEIYSNEDHCFNDGMGETSNFGYGGFPNRDSDIYGNRISHCWDDAIEAEGANLNVRIWGNYLETSFNALGLATSSLGPQYVFRNVSGFSRKDPPGFGPNPYPAGGYIFKLGTKRPRADTLARGRVYLFHNTILQPLHDGKPAGMRRGAYVTDVTYGVWNLTSRNNLLHTRSAQDDAVREPLRDPSNDFDHDLFTGRVLAAPGAQAHGINAAPRFAPGAEESPALLPDSPGYDAALRLPTINDDFSGRAPDMGAQEADRPTLRFGVEADWNQFLPQSATGRLTGPAQSR